MLKTLKDLEKEHEKYNYEDSLVNADELKEEAILLIKELEKATIYLNQDNIILMSNNSEEEAKAMVRVLKHIFDITEEDLKVGDNNLSAKDKGERC